MRLGLGAILAAAERDEGRMAIHAPEGWMQGRTVYGGVSTALAHEAARSLAPDLPPLRSAQVSFIGPLSGQLEARATLLRRGRSTAFVQADVEGEGGLGLRAMLVFTAERDSRVAFTGLPSPPAAPDPEAAVEAMRNAPANMFFGNFEFRHALADASPPAPEFLRWTRLREPQGLDPTTALLACADALPPAAMALMDPPGPISSITWLLNLLQPNPVSRDGWWLLCARAEQAQGGVSSQSMAIWDADRVPVAAGMQSVAVFA